MKVIFYDSRVLGDITRGADTDYSTSAVYGVSSVSVSENNSKHIKTPMLRTVEITSALSDSDNVYNSLRFEKDGVVTANVMGDAFSVSNIFRGVVGVIKLIGLTQYTGKRKLISAVESTINSAKETTSDRKMVTLDLDSVIQGTSLNSMSGFLQLSKGGLGVDFSEKKGIVYGKGSTTELQVAPPSGTLSNGVVRVSVDSGELTSVGYGQVKTVDIENKAVEVDKIKGSGTQWQIMQTVNATNVVDWVNPSDIDFGVNGVRIGSYRIKANAGGLYVEKVV